MGILAVLAIILEVCIKYDITKVSATIRCDLASDLRSYQDPHRYQPIDKANANLRKIIMSIRKEAAYEQHMTGVGPSYRERQRFWVQFMECGEEMELGSSAVHLQTQHGKAMGGRRHWVSTPLGGEPCT